MKRKHIVALSGGKDSTAMAVRLAELHPDRNYMYVCTPTGDELPEMFAHWCNLGNILGKKIIPITPGYGFKKCCENNNALPNWRMRFCTRQLKIEPFQKFVYVNSPAIVYVGLRADEEDREGANYGPPGGEIYGSIDGVIQKFPLRRWGWGIKEVWEYLDIKRIKIPKRTDCARCFFQRLGEWYLLWKLHPEVYTDAEQQEKEFGHTFRSDSRDSQPASLYLLRKKFEKGYIPRGTEKLTSDNRSTMCRVCRL